MSPHIATPAPAGASVAATSYVTAFRLCLYAGKHACKSPIEIETWHTIAMPWSEVPQIAKP